jgi:hypothetical protein
MQRSRPGPQHAGQDQGKTEVHSTLFMVKGHLNRDPQGSEDLKEIFLVHVRLVPLLVGQVVAIWLAVGGPRYPSAPLVSTAVCWVGPSSPLASFES